MTKININYIQPIVYKRNFNSHVLFLKEILLLNKFTFYSGILNLVTF